MSRQAAVECLRPAPKSGVSRMSWSGLRGPTVLESRGSLGLFTFLVRSTCLTRETRSVEAERSDHGLLHFAFQLTFGSHRCLFCKPCSLRQGWLRTVGRAR